MKSAMNWVCSTVLVLAVIRAAYGEDIVVFIPGAGGWGENEMFGIPYWGFDREPLSWILPGRQLNYPEELRPLVGLQTFVADVGPFSSAHDRACELYAMINGDIVDFGYFHSQEFGHDRYGRNFTSSGGFFRQGRLGEMDRNGNINRVHLIGHCFGGITARVFERLLHEGLASEREEAYPEWEAPISDLFSGDQQPLDGGWIRSLVALAAPFDGSTLHPRLGQGLTQAMESIASFFIVAAEFLGSDLDLVYDAKLDHFGISRLPGESCSEFWRRIFQSSFFDSFRRDSSEYDLSPRALFEFNRAGRRSYPGTYYLAYATHQTNVVRMPACSGRPGAGFDAMPNEDTEFFLKPFAALMGDLTDARLVGNQCFEEDVYKACDPEIPVSGPWNDKGYSGWCADNSYELNDGLVNTRSATGPEFGYPWDETRPRALALEYQERAGCMTWETMADDKWYFVEIGVDHVQIVGWRTEYSLENVNNVYLRDIPHLINRIKTGGDPESYICCVGEWCQQSTFDPPSPYPNGFQDIEATA